MSGSSELHWEFLGTRQEDFAVQIRYLNRARRWNWGATAEVSLYLRGGSRRLEGSEQGEPVFSKETERYRQMHSRVGGFLSYPFSRAQRVEIGGGVRYITSTRLLRSRVFSSVSRKLIRDAESETSAGRDVMVGETRTALIYDSAIWGPASPILGTRSRVELNPSIGGLSFTSMLVDYRRYVMPVKPFTFAARVQYAARLGRDANDERLIRLFVGYRNLIRGMISHCSSESAHRLSRMNAMSSTD